jgi:hypothetical protein
MGQFPKMTRKLNSTTLPLCASRFPQIDASLMEVLTKAWHVFHSKFCRMRVVA